MASRKNYALSFAAIVFFIVTAGRVVGSWIDSIELYDISVGLAFVAVFVYFAMTAQRGPKRDLVMIMLYFVIWACLKEFALSPCVLYVSEIPFTIYAIYIAGRLIVKLLSNRKAAPPG